MPALSLALVWTASNIRIRKKFLKEKVFPQLHWANQNSWFCCLNPQTFSQLPLNSFCVQSTDWVLWETVPSRFCGARPTSQQPRFCYGVCLQVWELRGDGPDGLSCLLGEEEGETPKKADFYLRGNRSPKIGSFLDRNRIIAIRMAYGCSSVAENL